MNKIFLVGNLTADPDYSVTSNGTPMCRFTVAVNRRFSGQSEERTADFFRVVTFRKTAENCSSFLAKGRKVGVMNSELTFGLTISVLIEKSAKAGACTHGQRSSFVK